MLISQRILASGISFQIWFQNLFIVTILIWEVLVCLPYQGRLLNINCYAIFESFCSLFIFNFFFFNILLSANNTTYNDEIILWNEIYVKLCEKVQSVLQCFEILLSINFENILSTWVVRAADARTRLYSVHWAAVCIMWTDIIKLKVCGVSIK